MQLNKLVLLLVFIFLGIMVTGVANAQPCPICVVAVGAGLGLSRWLGIDDVVSSIWIGALLMALVWWTLIWLRKKNWDFKLSGVVVFILYYGFTFVPLYLMGTVGHPLNKIFGIDRIIFGSVIGTIVFWAGLELNEFLKIKNNGKVFFPYQRVVAPVISLVLISLILWIMLKNL